MERPNWTPLRPLFIRVCLLWDLWYSITLGASYHNMREHTVNRLIAQTTYQTDREVLSVNFPLKYLHNPRLQFDLRQLACYWSLFWAQYHHQSSVELAEFVATCTAEHNSCWTPNKARFVRMQCFNAKRRASLILWIGRQFEWLAFLLLIEKSQIVLNFSTKEYYSKA